MSVVWDELRAAGADAGISLPWPVRDVVELQEHASTRSFYRLTGERDGARDSAVLVLYPPADRHEVRRYLSTAEWMRNAAVPVPEILAVGERAILVADGGDRLLAEAGLDESSSSECYERAAEIVTSIQRYGRREEPPNGDWALNEARLSFELEFFEENLIEGWLGETSRRELRARHYGRLVAAICELPVAVCHRDYHARNLMVTGDGLLVLDFQDVMWGPQLYDLASLIWDNYCDVPESVQEVCLRLYWDEMGESDLPVSSEFALPEIPRPLPPGARQAFCLVALQRHLKALGTFGYQVTRAGRTGYAKYITSTWSHAQRAARALEWDDLLATLDALDRRIQGGLLQ